MKKQKPQDPYSKLNGVYKITPEAEERDNQEFIKAYREEKGR